LTGENPFNDGNGDENIQSEIDGLNSKPFKIRELGEGQLFGEIGLITNLKRTATVKSMDHCTLSTISKTVLM